MNQKLQLSHLKQLRLPHQTQSILKTSNQNGTYLLLKTKWASFFHRTLRALKNLKKLDVFVFLTKIPMAHVL